MIPFSTYKREPASERDEGTLDDLIHDGDLALRILRANAALQAKPEGLDTWADWSDLIFSIGIEDPGAMLRAMPERATEIGISDADDLSDDLREVARWAFAHFVCASLRERALPGGRADVVAACVTCGVPLSWEYPGAWCHAPEGDPSGDAGNMLDTAHPARPGRRLSE